MAHGEAEHGCAQGEPCRLGHHEQPASAKHPRRLGGVTHPGEPTAGRGPDRVDDDPPAPRQRGPEPAELAATGAGARPGLPQRPGRLGRRAPARRGPAAPTGRTAGNDRRTAGADPPAARRRLA